MRHALQGRAGKIGRVCAALMVAFNAAACNPKSETIQTTIPGSPDTQMVEVVNLPKPLIEAPHKAIIDMAIQNNKIMVRVPAAIKSDRGVMRQQVNTVKTDPQLALDWAYAFAPYEVAMYFYKLENTVDKDCSGLVQNCPEYVRQYVMNLYKSYKPSPAFEQWDQAHRKVFVELASQDSVLIAARRDWDRVDTNGRPVMTGERLSGMVKRIVQLYSQAYSGDGIHFKAPGIEYGQMPAGVGAQYYPGEHKIKMPQTLPGSYDMTAEYAVHESRHGIESGLVGLTKTKEGREYLIRNGIDYEARIFRLARTSLRINYKSLDEDGYRFSPLEMDAYSVEKDCQMAGVGNIGPNTLYRHINAQAQANQDWRATISARFQRAGYDLPSMRVSVNCHQDYIFTASRAAGAYQPKAV